MQINNTAALADSQAQKAASVLKHGELLRTDRLETVLNNINDLAGVTAVGVLRAGQANGTSDFVIDLRADKPQQTILYTDNYGNKYSGRYRYGFQTTINNPGRIGDKFFLGGMLSNDNLHNYNLGYEMPVGSRVSVFSRCTPCTASTACGRSIPTASARTISSAGKYRRSRSAAKGLLTFFTPLPLSARP